jgi:uncharacterized protein (TIGR00369 family)
MTWATDRLDALVRREVEPPPVIRTLRLGTLDAWGPGWARKTWKPQPDLLNVDGSLFGGYVASLADQIMAFAVMTVLPGDMTFRTINLSVSFLRVGKDDPVTVLGRVTSQTRQMIAARAELSRPAGELIAEASAQQILQPYK